MSLPHESRDLARHGRDRVTRGFPAVGVAVLLAVSTILSAPATAANTVIVGRGTATIDGVIDAVEWADAAVITKPYAIPYAGSSGPATFFLMRDATHVYLAIRLPVHALSGGGLEVNFDNDRDGVFEVGEDAIGVSPDVTRVYDLVGVECPPYPPCRLLDTSYGGTNDSAAARGHDGTYLMYEISQPLASGDPNDISLTPSDPLGLFQFKVQLFDGAGSVQVWIQFYDLVEAMPPSNSPPVVDAGPDRTLAEARQHAQGIFGRASDPDGDTLSYTWSVFSATGPIPSFTDLSSGGTLYAVFPDDGTYVLRLTVSDGRGGVAFDDVTVTVQNVPPAVFMPTPFPRPPSPTLTPVPSSTPSGSSAPSSPSPSPSPSPTPTPFPAWYEGQRFSGQGVVSDPGADQLTASVSWGEDEFAPLALTAFGGFQLEHTFIDDGEFVVRVNASDDDGGQAQGTQLVKVLNIPPAGELTGPPSGTLYVPCDALTLTAAFRDPGVADVHTAIWRLSSGGAEVTLTGHVSEANGSGTATASFPTGTCLAPMPGIYTVTATVTDDDGGQVVLDTVAGEASPAFIVISSGSGAVAGGGWIESPAGAYREQPELSGPASFGFVSRYVHGASTPVGDTQFQFQVGGLRFHSSSYDWLVVSGARAQFKGTGSINGSRVVAFMLTAVDGEVSGGGGVDRFRLKLWDPTTGAVIYDNQMDAPDFGSPTTALTRGSIQIFR